MKTSNADSVTIVHQADLCDPREIGAYLRAYCHIHGSEHQRSLSIQMAGEYAGFGRCFACGARVLVAELNLEAAKRLERQRYQFSLQPPRSTCKPRARKIDLLKPPNRAPARASPAPNEWERRALDALIDLEGYMRQALLCPKARAYLQARAIPIEVAQAAGVGYIPEHARLSERFSALSKQWHDRVVFPLSSPQGKGYIGRSLWRWRPDMDEDQHKQLFDDPEAPKRYYKTTPAGCFGYGPEHVAPCVVLVEGAFDALALSAAGFKHGSVIALVGTPTHIDWLPMQVQSVVLALDADNKGRQTMSKLADQLTSIGVTVVRCAPPDDGLGKDWSERWRRRGMGGVRPVFEAWEIGLRDCKFAPCSDDDFAI